MQKPLQRLFSQKAQTVLAQFDAITETSKFIAEDGPLDQEIRAFLVSIAGMLKRDCGLQDWKHEFPDLDDGFHHVRMFPKTWELPPQVGPVALGVSWCNPFLDEAEDVSVHLSVPWTWNHYGELRSLITSHMPEGFTDIYDGDADQDVPLWRYIRFQDFADGSRIDVDAFYGEIVSSVQSLLSVRPIIDEYMARCEKGAELRTARRELGIVAVVDTETVGAEHELIELAIVNAAYDRQSGEVFGIVDQYEGLCEPKCKISKADQRLNGLGSDEVRGKRLDEARVKALLSRADFLVAHNSSFDQATLAEQFKWAANLDWRDSLNGIDWQTDSRDLQSLLTEHRVDCELAHRAGSDARALLELLSYAANGRTYLSQLLPPSAKAAKV